MNILFVLIGIILIIYIIKSVLDKTFDIYESIFWIIAGIGIILLAMFPKALDTISFKIGINYSPSLVFLLGISFLLVINFKHSKLLANEKQKTIELLQELLILKEKVKEIENKHD